MTNGCLDSASLQMKECTSETGDCKTACGAFTLSRKWTGKTPGVDGVLRPEEDAGAEDPLCDASECYLTTSSDAGGASAGISEYLAVDEDSISSVHNDGFVWGLKKTKDPFVWQSSRNGVEVWNWGSLKGFGSGLVCSGYVLRMGSS